MIDNTASQSSGGAPPEGGARETRYPLRDRTGKIVAFHVRFDYPDGIKEVKWQRASGEWGLNGTKIADLPLYGIHELHPEPMITVVVEGEPALDELERALREGEYTRDGIAVVATITGASTVPSPEVLEDLRGHDVVLWPDTDPPGIKHMNQLAEALAGIAAKVQMFTWHDAPEVWVEGKNGKPKLKAQDAADHPAVKSGDEKAMGKLVNDLCSAPEWAPSSSSSPLVLHDGDDGGAGAPAPLRLTSFASVKRPSDERPVVVQGMIPRRFPSILYGDGGTAKSLIAASLLLDVSRGAERWMGHRIRQHGPAIYLDFELDLEEQARRIYQLAEGVGLAKPPEDLYYLSGADHPVGAVLAQTLRLAKEKGAVIVLLDSLGFALEGDAEASRDVLRFVRAHIKPFEAAGITLLIVDHQSKLLPGEGYHQKSPFGSVYKSNACRSVIQVGVEDQQEGELIVRFRHAKANFGSKFDPFNVRVLFGTTKVEMHYQPLGTKELATEGSLNTTQKIRRLLKDGPMFAEELAEETGATEGSVKNCLTSLRKGGEIEDTGVTSKTGARQVRLVPPSSSSPRTRGGDGDDGAQKNGLAPEAVVAEFARHGSGAKINLPHYLRDDTTLEILTRSVLVGLGRDPDRWQHYAPMVNGAARDGRNHPDGCPCPLCHDVEVF